MQESATEFEDCAVSRYADLGFAIFPCHTVIAGKCSCGNSACQSIGKHPRTKNGLKDATVDSTGVRRWWPNGTLNRSNIAIATGEASDLVVIDVDPRHGGDETLTNLEGRFGPLPRDCTARTGGGGIHIYMRYPRGERIRSRNGWRPGVDVKANGGYVIAPPSVHASGTTYEWQSQGDFEPPPIPSKWLAALTETNDPPAANHKVTASGRSALLQRAQQYAASVSGATEGFRNDEAFRLAGHIAAFVTETGERLSESEILGVVQTWSARCSPPMEERELSTCVHSALQNGTPRADKQVRPRNAGTAEAETEDSVQEPDKPRKSQATLLVEMAADTDLFHDPDGEAYARFPVGEGDRFHWQVARVRTRAYNRWLAQRFFRDQGKVPAAQAQQDALGVIEARAVFDGDKRDVSVRVAQLDSRIYFDLANDRWQVLEIDRDGWRVLDDSPVMFRRSKAMVPAPTPVRNGSIQELRHFANVTDEDWPLVLAWLVAAMRPMGPYPVLAVYGEHGSGKSGLCRRLRSVVDPNTAPLRADYREPRDLMIGANSGWVMALDNLSHIPAWLSDCFCRLATGGGFSCRTLYENDEETIFNAQRPLMLNCIEEVVTRSDLLDRCVLLNLPRIEPARRFSEKQLDREFETAWPRILGGLLDAVVTALRNEDAVDMPRPPRMADFAIWATAAEPALGLAPGQFLAAYEANRAAGNETALEASPIGKALVEFVTEFGSWSGTSTELLRKLEGRAEEKAIKLKSWPSTARALGGAVKRLAPNLRDAGLSVELSRTGRRRLISLSRTGRESSVTNVTNVITPQFQGSSGDAPVTQSDRGDANCQPHVTADAPIIFDEFGLGDESDDGDAQILTHSLDPEWSEV